MHDIKTIRENRENYIKGLIRRNVQDAELMVDYLLGLDKQIREVKGRLQANQNKRNDISKLIGDYKRNKRDDLVVPLMMGINGLREEISRDETLQYDLEEKLKKQLLQIPNIPADDVPNGHSEADNVLLTNRTYGVIPNIPNPKQHFEIGEVLGLMDFERAVKVSGSRFVYLKGDLARLERALASFMIDTHTEKFGYTEVSPPVLVKTQALIGTGQLPKFKEDLYKVNDDFWLIPTAEVSLTNYVANEILNEDELPLRMVAHTPCFRAEAGAAGKDTRGMIRQHQFSKVELVSITTPEQSAAEHERMTDAAQEILKKLQLTHRVTKLCTGDMGFSSQKTYDIEVWLPGQNTYREISSVSNCGDFQARRMNTRYRNKEGKVVGPIHTLNGSGLAIGRTLVAILENYQQVDGSVIIPLVLQPYMNNNIKLKAI